MFLLPEEIKQLTGYKRKAEQRDQLRKMGISFHVNRLGTPLVLRETLLNTVAAVGSEAMPDLVALEELENAAKKAH